MTTFKPLRELVTFRGGGTPSKQVPDYWDGDIPWASVKDFTSTSLSETQDFITQEGLRNSSANLIPKGHVIIPTRMSLGKAAINAVDLAINQDLRALIPKVPLDANFLLHAVLSLKEEIVKKGSGATVKGITQEELYKLEIPVPEEFEDQIRIAHLLGKIEGLIAQRKQHLQQLDDLLKSVFLDMFGDPILNPHGFPVRKLSEFYVNPKEGTKCGPFGSALKKEEVVDSGVPVWNMDNIAADGRMVLPFRMWITADKYDELMAYSVRDGDIIISRAGTVGKMCVARMNGQPAIISTNLIRLRLDDELRPLHFVSLMLYCKGRVGRLKTGPDGAFTHMNTGVLDSLEFPYPSIELQDQFAAIAEKVEDIKSRYQQNLADLESLYGALSQQAFKGELGLSRVPLEKTPGLAVVNINGKSKPLNQGFARQLLAAEILHRHNDNQMTQMKLQKLIHLVEHHAQLDEIQGDYQRQAAGPFDNKMMYGIADGLKKQQWFSVSNKRQQNAHYTALAKVGNHEKYLVHWQPQQAKIDEVLSLLGGATPEQCEIVSTLYAAWNDLLIEGKEIIDAEIIRQVSKAELWHCSKEKIEPAKWPKALQWMRNHHLVPTGYGKHTRKLS